MVESNLGYFLIALLVLFGVGIISTNVLSLYYDTSTANNDTLLGNSSIYTYFINGFSGGIVSLQDLGLSLFGFDLPIPFFNPFYLLGSTATTYISNSLIALTYLPDAISIPFLILLCLTFIIFIIKIIFP